MDKDARVRLLIGREPNDWQDWGKGTLTNKAAPHFLAHHLKYNNQYDRAAVPVLERLARPQATGRQEVRLRHPRAAVRDAAFYLDRMQVCWKVMDWPGPNRPIQTFLESMRRLELLSPELGEEGSALT